MKNIFGLKKRIRMPKMNIIGDGVTKPQRQCLRKNNIFCGFSDFDGDGVINGLDCQPRNPKRHNRSDRDRNSFIIPANQDPGYRDYKVNQTQQEWDRERSYSFFRKDPVNQYMRNNSNENK